MVNKFKKYMMKRQMMKTLKPMVENHKEAVDEIQDKICSLLEKEDETKEMHLIVILVTSIMSGFEDKNERLAILDMIKETVKEYDN